MPQTLAIDINAFITAIRPHIRALAVTLADGFNSDLIDDLEQEAMVKVWQNINKWNARQMGASAFALMYARFAMLDHLRKEHPFGRKYVAQYRRDEGTIIPKTVTLSSCQSEADRPVLDPEHTDSGTDEFKSIVKQLCPTMSPVWIDILAQYFVHGTTYKELGERHGVTESAMCKHVRIQIDKIRESMGVQKGKHEL